VIAWLRSYSNYLTPKLGITSADTWAALALVLRNLTLNWFVILPALCLALLVAKGYAFSVAWFSQFSPLNCDITLRTALAGGLAIFVALFFTHVNRPTHNDSMAATRDVLLGSLVPATLSGVFLSFALATPCAHDTL
jgi:hypothetical protein